MSGGHSEIDKLINHFNSGGTRDSFKRGGKIEKYKEGGKPMTAQEEASDDAAYYAHIRKTNPDKYYEMFPDAPGEPGDEVGPFGVKDGAFSKKKIRERKEKRRIKKHSRYERKMERKHGEDWDVHGEYDEGGAGVPDKPKKKKGGKVLSEDLSLSHKEAGHTPKNPPEGMVYDPITKKFVTKHKSKGESVISPKKKKGIPLSEQETKMTILGPLPTGKSKIYKEGGKPMTAQEEASDDAAYYAHIRKTNPDKYYEMFPDAPGEPGDEVGPFGVKDGAFSKKKIRERKEKRRIKKHSRYERKMERKHGEDWDVHGEYDEGGAGVPDKPKKKKGGKVLSEDLSLSHKEAGHTPKNPPEGMVYDPITKKFVTKHKSKGESVISPKKKSKRGADKSVKMTILGVMPTGKDKIYKKGGKVKKEDFAAHVKEATSMDKGYSEYNRPKTSYEKPPKKKSGPKIKRERWKLERERWKSSKKGVKY